MHKFPSFLPSFSLRERKIIHHMDMMGGYYGGDNTGFFPAEKRLSDQRSGGGDHNHNNFMVDELLDFSNTTDDDHDAMVTDDFLNIEDAEITKNSNDHSSTALTAANTTTTDSCNSSSGYGHSVADSHFSNELCVPYDDMAELEWLSNFVEDSFSTDQNLQTNLHILAGSKPTTPESSSSETTHIEPTTRNPIFQPEPPRPGKARSKRSRVAPCDWSTRLLHLAPTAKPSSKKPEKPNPSNNDSGSEGVVRSCLHCASEKTPQWRTGPMGPKTLCNACGVRYKSGRLVPEYRPAASPTFISAKHSNSHRKVVELRRQKEMMQRGRQEQFLGQSSIFGVSQDFLFHHQSGQNNFTHLI